MKKLLAKLRGSRGDTMIEILAALLVVVLCMSFLCNSLATAAKNNEALMNKNILPATYALSDEEPPFPSDEDAAGD